MKRRVVARDKRSRSDTAGKTLTGVVIVALVINGLVTTVWSQQRRLIYFPTRGRVPLAATMIPGAHDVVLETADGLRLGAWYLPGSGRGPAVLVCNGNGGDRAGRAPLAMALHRAGLSVLLFDYRGYAENPGHPSEEGLAFDAAAARDWLAARPEVDDQRLVYFGESLGAAVSLRLALERPPAALVLRSPFTSLADAGRVHYPRLFRLDAQRRTCPDRPANRLRHTLVLNRLGQSDIGPRLMGVERYVVALRRELVARFLRGRVRFAVQHALPGTARQPAQQVIDPAHRRNRLDQTRGLICELDVIDLRADRESGGRVESMYPTLPAENPSRRIPLLGGTS